MNELSAPRGRYDGVGGCMGEKQWAEYVWVGEAEVDSFPEC